MIDGLLTKVATYARCAIWNKAIVDDGYGGYKYVWTRGPEFDASIVSDVSTEARIAASTGVRDTYTVFTGLEMVLMGNTVFERIKDGKLFRVTSDGDEKRTPDGSPMRLRMVKAEEWSMPSE